MLFHLGERAKAPYPFISQSLDAAAPGRGRGFVQGLSPHRREPGRGRLPAAPQQLRASDHKTEQHILRSTTASKQKRPFRVHLFIQKTLVASFQWAQL